MKNDITPGIVEEFKKRMHISHGFEDENLERTLSASVAALIARCGDFDIQENEVAKELVFERARYAYNDSLEFFDTNFLSDIHTLGFMLLEMGDPVD